MPRLSREQILGAADRKAVEVEVPEWGGSVRLMAPTAAARDRFEQWCVDRRGKPGGLEGMRAQLVSMTAVDDAGAPLFTEADLAALSGKNADALDRLVEKSRELAGLAPGSVEAAAKN